MMTNSRNNFLFGILAGVFLLITHSSVSIADTYPAGTFSVKPLNVNISSFAFGLRNPDSKLSALGRSPAGVLVNNNALKDVYKSPFSLGFHESDRNGAGYGIELGYVIGWDIEVLFRAGFSKEHGFKKIQLGERSLDFRDRNSYGLGLGLRKYFDVSTSWRPFIAIAGGVTKQGATKAIVKEHPFNAFSLDNDRIIGQFTLLGNKTLYSFELNAGTDYVFTERWALTFNVGIRYGQNGGTNSINTPGVVTSPARIINYKDNRDKWTVPVTVSLKFIL